MASLKTKMVIILGVLLVGAGIACIILAVTGNMPGSGPGVERTTPWTKAEVTLGNTTVPIEYQRFATPMVLPAPITGKVTGPSATPVTTVLSSIYSQAEGGDTEQWLTHFIDPSVAARSSLADMTDQKWKEICEYTKTISYSVLGTIRHGKYTLVIMKYRSANNEGFMGIPTIEREGKYYRDAEARKCLDPVHQWLSANEYPMVTGVTSE